MSIPSWAVKGAKCACTWGGYWALKGTSEICAGPRLNEVVTIEAVDIDPLCGVMFVLAEYPIGEGYSGDAFRPIHSVESDLKAHFSQYLNSPHPVTTKQRERA